MEPTKNFFRVSHDVLEHPVFIQLPPISKVLYMCLCKLRNRYQRGKKKYFIRTNKQLMKDTNLSLASVKRAKTSLNEARFILSVSSKGRRTKHQIFEIQEWLKQFEDTPIPKKVEKQITRKHLRLVKGSK